MTKKRLLAIGATTLAMTLALILAFNTQNALATFDWDVADGSILPTSYSADKNEWQLVSGEYNGNYDPFTADEDGTDTSVLTHKTVISDDGMVRVQKNVIPTDVENEFLVYMSMDAKTTQKVTQTDVTEYLGNLAYYENWSANSGGAYGDLGTPKGSIKEDGNRGHITIIMRYHGQIVGQGEVDAGVPNSYVYLEVGDNFITLGNFPNKASSVTFDVELTDRAYDALFETISSQTESTETVIGMDASSNAKVVDTMGEYIVYDGVEKKDSAATVTSGDNSITWNVVGKTDAEQSEHVTTQTTTQQGTDTVVTETVTYWWNYGIRL